MCVLGDRQQPLPRFTKYRNGSSAMYALDHSNLWYHTPAKYAGLLLADISTYNGHSWYVAETYWWPCHYSQINATHIGSSNSDASMFPKSSFFCFSVVDPSLQYTGFLRTRIDADVGDYNGQFIPKTVNTLVMMSTFSSTDGPIFIGKMWICSPTLPTLICGP